MQEVVEINFIDIEQKEELKDFIKQVIDTCFIEEKLKDLNFYLSISLTSPKVIHNLNKKFRNVDKETDVLSFPIFTKDEIDKIINKQKKNFISEPIGDIVISVEKVENQAKEYGHTFERELAYMIVHGFYHIIGYDHIEEKDKIIMRLKEEKILEILQQTR